MSDRIPTHDEMMDPDSPYYSDDYVDAVNEDRWRKRNRCGVCGGKLSYNAGDPDGCECGVDEDLDGEESA